MLVCPECGNPYDEHADLMDHRARAHNIGSRIPEAPAGLRDDLHKMGEIIAAMSQRLASVEAQLSAMVVRFAHLKREVESRLEDVPSMVVPIAERVSEAERRKLEALMRRPYEGREEES